MAKNTVTLGDNQTLDNNLKPIKVGGEASIINVSSPTEDNSVSGKVMITGDLEVTGNTKGIVSGSTDTNTTYTVSTVDHGASASKKIVRLTGSDSSTDDVTFVAGTGITLSQSSDEITITNSVTDTDTVLTSEQVQDIVGAMFSSNTETNIAVTYEDGDGTLDLVAVGDVTLAGSQTFTGLKTFNKTFPQVRHTDDSSTDYVDIGLSGNTYYHKTSDTGINFGWRDNSNNDILSIDTSAQTVTIGESSQETYALKIGDNGRMNMPVRGFEFENAHGYFSPLGDMHMPLYINVTQTDLIRFQTPITWEYYDYSASAWVDDSSNVSNLQNMLDGRRGTNYAVSNTKRKFRFVIQRSSSWADDHLFYIENTWSSIGTWSSSATGGGSLTPTMVVERLDGSFDASDDSANDWTTNSGITTDWHTTGIWDQFGMGMYYSTGMHNTETHIRITVTFPEYADASKEINIKNIGVMSSYSSQNTNQDAFVQDFNRNLTGYGSISIPTGDTYKINATTVLSGNGLGSGIINSSLTSVGTISSGTWNGTAIASAYLDADTAHLSGNQTFTGVKTFGNYVNIETATDAILNFKSTDDGWCYIQYLQNDGDRIAYIGIDSDQDRLILNATENGANEIEINTTTVDINANVDISGIITNAEWNGDVIASAYLDSDTAHLSTTQTFSGTKTFSANAIFGGDITINADGKIKSDTSGTWNFIEFDDDSGSPENQTLVSSVTNVALIVDGNNNGTGHFEVLKGGTDGTATELFRLENDGDAVFTSNVLIQGGGNNIIFGEPGDGTSQNYGIQTDGNLYLDIDKDNDNTGNFFQFRSNQATTSIMRLQDTGEVGIGTTSPSQALDVTGNIAVSGTVDGRDLQTDGTKLDGIEASADVTDTANVTSAGALMDSELTDLAGVKGVTISTLQVKPSEGAFANGDKTKLDGIASGATANTGDITRVKLIGDSGDYTINSGNADIRFQGAASYIQTEVDDTTVIFDLASSSSSAKGIVELATTAETTTGTDATRAVTPDGLKDSGYMGFEFRQLINAGFNYSYTAGTKVYIPLVGYILERNSQFSSNEYLSYVAPYDGYLNQVIFRSEEACGSTVVGFHKSSTGTEHPNATASDSVTVDMSADDTSYKFAFTGGISGNAHQFSAGDIINISFDPTNDANDVVFTAEFILNSSSGL